MTGFLTFVSPLSAVVDDALLTLSRVAGRTCSPTPMITFTTRAPSVFAPHTPVCKPSFSITLKLFHSKFGSRMGRVVELIGYLLSLSWVTPSRRHHDERRVVDASVLVLPGLSHIR
ncbi:uncharacterized protein C8Q71DRAFT_754802 [Rhodofomes roseus]|uniref:Secreted protein n=1 Tax=Rhodofomes roseus TaxID=34475 RepID=A0ABQ8KJ95_9APHY|nr:uncharacterized protein C8Q71DRAFT_754802 [Rhodofomes roseus]KAH9837840.1 hypothetical protein C8Q71DRAFT_754802 [Rhodofomes roseus]